MPATPITIGELTDVPTFDSPITSPWAQDVSRMVVHRFANVAARDAFGSWPNGRMAYTADTQTLWLRETGGWVIVTEPPQATNTNVWANGVGAWINAYGLSGAPVVGANTSFQRSLGMVYVSSDGTFNGAGGYTPQLALPFNYARHIEGVLQVAVLQPGRTYFPGWCVSLGGNAMQPYVTSADTLPGGLNSILRTPINTVTPFNWGVAGGTITVSGWYQMATRYS